jgi:3-oxoacyl-[acyl-carrier protein] reductase
MLEGQVVLVTGGSRGIGRYIAHTFAKEGAHLAIADIEPMDKIAGELREMEAEALTVTADVTDEEQVRGLMRQVVDRFGRIDVLVNNAGIVPHFAWGVPRWSAIRELDKSFWDKVINTNLGGSMLCTKHALPYMRSQGSGHIINLYGGGGGTGAAAYVVSKDAIKSFTHYVAEEERDANVCIVCVSPGGTIATEMAPEEARQRLPGPELAGNRFVLAAQVGMEMSGHLLNLQDGKMVIAE